MEYLSLSEYARKLGVTPGYVRRLVRARRIPGARRVAGRWLIPADARVLPAGEQAEDVQTQTTGVVHVEQKQAQVYAIFNHAGGAGKTTLARDLGYALHRRERRVLLIDADPQANLSAWLGASDAEDAQTLLYLLEEDVLPEPLEVHGMHLIPAHLNLALLDIEVRNRPGGDFLLRNALQDVRDRYDVILIDSPPSLGPLSFVCGLAADGLIVPVENSPKGLSGIKAVRRAAQQYKRALRHPGRFIRAFVPNKVDARTAVDRALLEGLEGLKSIAPVAPHLTYRPGVHKRAMAQRVPLLEAAPDPDARRELERLVDFLEAHVFAAEVAG